MDCVAIYRAILRRSAGDHGGHIIGYTHKTNRPIYASHHESNKEVISADNITSRHARRAHPNFSAADHLDAAEAHADEASRATNRAHREGSHKLSQAHSAAAMAVRADAKT